MEAIILRVTLLLAVSCITCHAGPVGPGTGSTGASGADGPFLIRVCPSGTSCTCGGWCCPLSGTCLGGVCYSTIPRNIRGSTTTTTCGQLASKCPLARTCCFQGYTCCAGTYSRYFCCPRGSTCNRDGTCTVAAIYYGQYCSAGTGYTGIAGQSGLPGPA